MDDWQLLRDYAERGSEAAFQRLVERHLDLVHAAACRQALNPQLAEEVSQAVFLLLARKASSLPKGTLISGWLYRTTRFVAQRAARAEVRRRHREQQAVTMQDPLTPSNAWDQLSPLIDEGMAALPETDRHALLLRHLENRPYHEVGTALGISEEAAKKRASRALAKLRAFLTRRGLAVPVGVLAVALSEHGTQAAPAGLAANIAANLSAAVAPQPPLVQEALDAWRRAHLRLTAGLAAGSLAVITALTVFIRSWYPSPNPALPERSDLEQRTPSAPGAASPLPVPAAANPTHASGPTTAPGPVLYLYLVDDSTGRGIPSARICLNTVEGGDWKQRDDLLTDDKGVIAIPYPPQTMRLDVGVVSDGWTARYATFRPHNEDPIPAEYTLRVSPVTEVLGGRVLSPTGQPVAGAEIGASFRNRGDASARESPRERLGAPIWPVVIARSDSEGRWTSAVIPRDHPGFELEARHPDFARTPIIRVSPGAPLTPPTPSTGGTASLEDPGLQLWAGTLRTMLRSSATLAGRVMDAAGAPIPNALIAHEPHSVEPITTHTDADGRFTLAHLEPERFDVTVSAPGFAPAYHEVDLTAEHPPLEVRLAPAAVLRLRVTDDHGVGVPDIDVGLEQWGERRHKIQWSARSDAEGRVVWDSAPVGERLELYARGDGWCYTRDLWITPDDDEHPIPVRRALRLTGVVTDATSGHLLAEFKAYPGYGDGQYAWERSATRHGTNGVVEVDFTENRLPWRLRVEAEGYETFTSEPLDPATDSPPASLEIALRPLDPEASIRGVVLGPDDRPLADIDVGLLTLEHDVQLAGQALITHGGDQDPWIARTDAEGRFAFPPNPIAHSVVAASPQGFARVVMLARRTALTLRLKPWGGLQGVVAPEVREEPVEDIWLMHHPGATGGGRLQLSGDQSTTSLREDGTFIFGPLPPGCYVLWVNPGSGKSFRYRTPVRVRAGETTAATIGLRGPRVRGRLVLSPSISRPTGGWFPINLSSTTPPPPPPRTPDFDRSLAAVEYWESPAGQAWALEGVQIAIQPDADGAFITDEGLRPGDYLLTAYTRTGKVTQRVIVPESGASLPAIDLGTIVLGNTDATSAVP